MILGTYRMGGKVDIDDGHDRLSVGEVIEIKRLLKKSDMSKREIAEMYHISLQSVNRIQDGRTWKHVKCEPLVRAIE